MSNNKNQISAFSNSEDIVISGSGYHHPEEYITNEELVDSFNKYVDSFNAQRAAAIHANQINELKKSSVEFIETASGIKSRYVRDKKNVLDINVMWPYLEERSNEQLSLQAETSVLAAKAAMKAANKEASEIDAVILACSHKQRDYPPVSIEIQKALGISGFAHDLGAACSSATFGIHAAVGCILAGSANVVLVVSPEIKSGQFSPKDRDSHFIFGEATSALIIEKKQSSKSKHNFKILDISLHSEFSNNIRNNRGAYNNCAPDKIFSQDKVFRQNGRAVYKDVTELASKHILKQLSKCKVDPQSVARFWLHQANVKINNKIISNILQKKDFDPKMAPETLSEFGNTSSSGVVVAFSKYHQDLVGGDKCIFSSFGAGYAIGSILLEKVG
jgi:beta-ketodecanoyl-[acyl-carrier-protein] synthase